MTAAPVPESRPTCPRCRQPTSGCWCAGLVPRRTRAKVVLLQHPREARNPVGTARMAHLALEGSSLLVGVDFAERPEFRELLERERERSVVLFPAPGARDLRELAGREPPPTVWVIDGTWSQAQKIWKKNPRLRELPAYRIEPRQPSQYGFRSEPAPHCISTIEAVAELVDALEGDPAAGAYEAILQPFRALVTRQLSFGRSPGRAPRRRAHPRPPRPFALPAPLDEEPERAVVFFAEGNGWPATMHPLPPTELLQLLALRPATGERFAAFARPSPGLSPTALENQGLAAADLAGWLEAPALLERWRAFARPGDVLCGWGHTSASLLAGAGLAPGPVVDLRLLCNRLLRARVGRVEDAHGQFELPAAPARAPGRGGRRQAMLEAVWAKLVASVSA